MRIKSDLRKSEEALSHVLFIRLPERLKAAFGTLVPEGDLLLPVETAGVSPAEGFDSRSITTESIVAGMLRVLAWQPDHPDAERYRSIVRAARPELLADLSGAGVAKAQAREWDVAEEIFRALAGLYPEAPEPFLDLALLYEDRAKALADSGRTDEAEAAEAEAFAIYREFLEVDPPYAPAYYSAALFFLKAKNHERAHSLLSTYIGIGDDPDRIGHAKELVRIIEESGCLETLFSEAYDFIRMGQEERGIEKARAFIERHPEVWNGWFLLGWGLRRLKRWEHAAAAFRKVVELKADEIDAYNELALCLGELGSLAEARRTLEKALRIDGENVKVIANLGVVALKQGRTEEAAGFFRTVLDIEPEDPVAAAWLGRIAPGEA